MRGIIGAATYSPSLRPQFAKSQAMLTNLGMARMFKAQPHDFPDAVDDLCFQVTGNCISLAMLGAASSAVCVLTLVWPLTHTQHYCNPSSHVSCIREVAHLQQDFAELRGLGSVPSNVPVSVLFHAPGALIEQILARSRLTEDEAMAAETRWQRTARAM